MKAISWTTWERHLVSTRVQTRTGTAALCLTPWDQILPEEGIEERMSCKEPLWRTWERYLALEKANVAHHMLSIPAAEVSEKVKLSLT